MRQLEIMDRYGRFLCYINRYQPSGTRPLAYNERLLEKAVVVPYLIWPNINPFHRAGSLVNAVIPPGKAKDTADKDSMLKKMRKWARDARNRGDGIYNLNNPLQLLPFELRFIARQQPPNRWVIDLSKNDTILIKPQNYYTVPNMEDRLFIPEEYVPLFVEEGWNKEA